MPALRSPAASVSAALRLSTFARLAPLAGLAFAATVAPAACSSGNAASPAPGGNPEAGVRDAQAPTDAPAPTDAGGNPPVARFVLGAGTTPSNFLDVPFPSDAYLSGGNVMSAIPGLENTIPNDTSFINYGLSKLNGFSRLALAIFAVDSGPYAGDEAGTATSALIDPTTLPVAETDCQKATSSVYLVDLASGATTPILPCRAAFHDDQPKAQTTPVIALGPPRGYLLQEGHQYATVHTSRVKDTSGRSIAASKDFAAVAAGSAPGAIGTMYNAAYTAASSALKTMLAADGATIVSIAPFTTMKKSHELFAMRDALEATTAPKLAWDATSMAPMGTANSRPWARARPRTPALPTQGPAACRPASPPASTPGSAPSPRRASSRMERTTRTTISPSPRTIRSRPSARPSSRRRATFR